MKITYYRLLLFFLGAASAAASGCGGGLKSAPTPVGSHSTLTGTGPISSDGVAMSAISIHLEDGAGVPFTGVVPHFTASGSGNTYGACSTLDASGNSTCSLFSTTAETKSLYVSSPVSVAGGQVVFVPSAASHVVLINAPSSGLAVSTLSAALVFEIQDIIGRIAETSTKSATLAAFTNSSCTLAATGTLSATRLKVAAAAGTGTFTNVKYNKAETIYLMPKINGMNSACVGPIVISSGSANKLGFSTQPSIASTASVAMPRQPVVTVQDASGNTVPTGTNSDAAVTLGLYSNAVCSAIKGGVFTVTTNPVTALNGVAAFSGVSSTISSYAYIKASAPGLTSACSLYTYVSATTADAAHSSITATTKAAANGIDYILVTVTLQDQYGNPAASITPTYSVDGTGNTVGACGASNSLGVSTCQLKSTVAENKSINLLTPTPIVGPTVTFIPPPDATQSLFSVSGTSIIANNLATPTVSVTLLDSGGSPVVGLAPKLSVTGSGNTANCPQTDVNGFSSCTVVSTKAETKNISMSQPVVFSAQSVTYIPGPASKLVFSTQPSTTVAAGVSLLTPPVVQVTDNYGNFVIDGATATAAVQLSATTNCVIAGAGVFSASVNPVVASSGSASFSGISYTTAGALYIKASAPGLANGCSNLVTVSAAGASKLAFTLQPPGAVSVNTEMLPNPAVQILDAYGNLCTTGANSTLGITVSAYLDGACTLPAQNGVLSTTVSPTAALGGISTLDGVTYSAPDTIYIKAYSGALTSACSTAVTNN